MSGADPFSAEARRTTGFMFEGIDAERGAMIFHYVVEGAIVAGQSRRFGNWKSSTERIVAGAYAKHGAMMLVVREEKPDEVAAHGVGLADGTAGLGFNARVDARTFTDPAKLGGRVRHAYFIGFARGLVERMSKF